MTHHLNPEFALEAQDDHIKDLVEDVKYWLRIEKKFALKFLTKLERFYPNHPTTLKMRAEFDQLKEQP